MSKLKKLVVAAEEEIKRWGKTGSLFVENAPAFSFFSPSFFYSKSQLLYQALQGSCHVYIIMVYKTGELESCLVKGGFALVLGNCLGGFFRLQYTYKTLSISFRDHY